MSAFICGEKTHKALASFAASRGNGGRHKVDPQYLRKVKEYPTDSVIDIASFFADILYQENIRSVSARYPSDTFETLPGPIEKEPALTVNYNEFEALAHTDPVTILKLADCLEYQSCETDDWEKTAAYELLERIRKAAIHRLPGYDEAPWGF